MRTTRALTHALSLVAFLTLACNRDPGTTDPQAGRDPSPIEPPAQHAASGFVPNVGQWDHPARYVARFGAGHVFPDDGGWTIALAGGNARGAALRMRVRGANATDLVPGARLGGTCIYFLGDDPARWRTEVARYRNVTYRNLLPGVDIEVYDKHGRFEYDLVVAAGTDATAIEIDVEGAESLTLDADGDLVIATPLGSVRQPKPVTYELDASGHRTPIDCRFELRSPTCFAFVTVPRHQDRTLVIDPGLDWSTFVGGSGDDLALAMHVAPSGVITLAGYSASTNYPTTTGAYDTTNNGTYDIVVTRLDPSQPVQLAYSTYLGGNGADAARGIAVAPTGVITIVGDTSSPDYPTTPNAYRRTYGQGGLGGDVVVSQLDPSRAGLQQLTYSTYVGSSQTDYGATRDRATTRPPSALGTRPSTATAMLS